MKLLHTIRTPRFLLFPLLLLLMHISCRKADKLIPSTEASTKEMEQIFFNAHTPQNATVAAIKGWVQRSHEKAPLVNTFVERAGYPRWDKARVFVKPTAMAIATETDSNAQDYALVYIPFVQEIENYVNSLMVVKTTATDTVSTFLMDWQYESYGFDKEQIRSAHSYFYWFAYFDYSVFGHRRFLLKDERLLSHLFHSGIAPTNRQVYIMDVENESNRMMSTPDCSFETVSITTLVMTGECNCGSRCTCTNRVCPSGVCSYSSTKEILVYVCGGGGGGGDFWDDPPPPPPPGEGGGGGGNNIPTNPPNDECNQRPRPRWCDRPWVPVVEPDPIAENLKKAYLKGKTKSDSLFNAAQNDPQKRERAFSYALNNSDTVVYNIVTGSQFTSQPVIGNNIVGVFHTHQDEGPGNANQSFDGPDIFKMYAAIVNNKPFQFQIIQTRDFIYAAYITDYNKFKNYVRQLCGGIALRVIEQTLFMIHYNEWNNCISCSWQQGSEKGTLAITANNNSDVSGIKIYRSDKNNINFQPLTP